MTSLRQQLVTVTGNGETNIVVNDGVNITITKIKKDKTQSTIQKEIKYETEPSLAAISSTGSLYTTFWNYSYYWSDNSFNSSGIWWSLSSGNTYGSAAHFDNRDLTARDYAERFMADVNDIQNQQVGAIAALGFAAASAIAAALTAETGIGGVVGIVLALGGTIGSAGFWVSAYTSSVSANYNFSQFKNVLRIY